MAWYKAGAVNVTNGGVIVTGAGTDFTGNVSVGEGFFGPDLRTYEIASIESATQLTLARPYGGGTANGAAYSILPTQSAIRDLYRVSVQFLEAFQAVRDTAGQGMFADGSAASPGIRFVADQDTGLARLGPNTFGAVTGGRVVARYGAFAGFLSEPANGYAIDVYGRPDATAMMRFINNENTVATGTLGYDNNVGMQLTSNVGAFRIVVTNALSMEVRIGGVGATVTTGAIFHPGVDNTLALGHGGSRWTQVFAVTGAINTSDEREKTWRGALTPAELAAARAIVRDIGAFQWNDAIAEKGADGARLHIGVKAQHTIALMEAEGLDPMRYAFICYDEWEAKPAEPNQPAVPATPEQRDPQGALLRPAMAGTPAIPGTPARPAGNRYGIRPDQLALFIAAAQEQRLAALEAA